MEEPLPQQPRWARSLPLPLLIPAVWPVQGSWAKLSVLDWTPLILFLSGSKHPHRSVLASEGQLTSVWHGASPQPGPALVLPPVLCRDTRLPWPLALARVSPVLGYLLQPPLLLLTVPQRLFLWGRHSLHPRLSVLVPLAEYLGGSKHHRWAVLGSHALFRLAWRGGRRLPCLLWLQDHTQLTWGRWPSPLHCLPAPYLLLPAPPLPVFPLLLTPARQGHPWQHADGTAWSPSCLGVTSRLLGGEDLSHLLLEMRGCSHVLLQSRGSENDFSTDHLVFSLFIWTMLVYNIL